MATTGAQPLTSIVLYPSPGIGHLVSMVELAKLFLDRGLAVTILVLDRPYNTTNSTSSFVAAASAATPSLSFHRLPAVSLPATQSTNHEALTLALVRLSNRNLKAFLLSAKPRALVVDFFCGCAIDVGKELDISCYFFLTSGAGFTAASLYLPFMHETTTLSFRELGREKVQFPGLPAIPGDHMAMPLLDRDDEAYKGMLYSCERHVESQGFIVNTFEALEPAAMAAMHSGRCVPPGRPSPPVYAIGPLIMTERRGKGDGRHECLSWLDEQPDESVVFLCFGSLGVFSSAQLFEIAAALESSGHRFLWVVRSPPGSDAKWFDESPLKDLAEILPTGFLDRTAGRGIVLKSWAPQVEVLRHRAVGAFATHLGWNSVLEAVTAGVAMIGWPLYAEQRMNKVFMEDLGLVAAVEGYDGELVGREEIERKVKLVMESEEGKELRARTKAMKAAAEKAVGEGGTSEVALRELVGLWK